MEAEKITGKIVKQACSRMKPGKVDVTESYTSDVLLNGPDLLLIFLQQYSNLFLSMVQSPSRYSAVLSCHSSKGG